VTAVLAQMPAWQLDDAVQMLRSSHGVPSAIAEQSAAGASGVGAASPSNSVVAKPSRPHAVRQSRGSQARTIERSHDHRRQCHLLRSRR
jgi:hypothetical protein